MKQEKAIFAAGCFWGVQHQFQRVNGVLNTVVGYTGGPEENPKYPEVKAHQTHHVEAIVVDYDADIVSYEDLCKVFFEIHDPAQTDGVGPDIGPQYRSEIFYLNEEQKEIAGLFNATIHKVETKEEMEKALKETIIRVKENSMNYRSAHLPPTDMAGLMKIVQDKKDLAELEKLHISLV